MSRSAIATTRKKPQTPGQRLHALDPDLAKMFDEWEAQLNQDYDLAMNENPAPPILDEEERLAFELGQFALAAEPMLDLADRFRRTRDEAVLVSGRLEQRIAQLTLEALQLTPQAALSPPPDRDDDWGDPTEDYRFLRADPVPTETGPDGLPIGTPDWDDPEGAQFTTWQPPRSKWSRPGYARKWWAGATAIITLPLAAAAAIIARWGW